jgi:hypothetical protein
MITSNGGGASRSSPAKKLAKWESIDGSFWFFLFFCFWLGSYSQKAINQVCFLKISIAKIHQNFKKKFHISLHMVQVAKYRRICVKILLSYLAYSQIWLNLLVDHHHFGSITKLAQKKNTNCEY